MKIWRPTELPIDPHTVSDVGFARMRVTSPYGNRVSPFNGQIVFHDGLDIGNAREGDWLVADASGRVIVASAPGLPWSTPTNQFPSGNWGGFMVAIDHGEWVSVYAHMQPTLLVDVGDDVRLGDRLGKVGSSGSAAPPPLGGGAHVHYGHIMATVAQIRALGTATKPTRNPWVVIDPIGPKPRIETELERLRRVVVELRTEKPKARQWWVDHDGLVAKDDGEILTTKMRLRAEVLYLRRA